MKMFRRDEGFTLVELMVVVLIIGILVAIAIPIFNAAKANAQTKACFANQRTLEGAYQTYAASNNGVGPGSGTTGVDNLLPDYIKANPVCPLANNTGYGFDTTGTITIFPKAGAGGTDCNHGHYK